MPATVSSAPTTGDVSTVPSLTSSPRICAELEQTMYLPSRNHRVLIMGRNGAVGANHPLATQAGLDTLRAGGNAVDASVAISLTLGVVEPGMSGLGGDGFYQVYTAGDAASRCYNAMPRHLRCRPDR